jgi:hypothetical protein
LRVWLRTCTVLLEDERDVWERGPLEWELCPPFANAPKEQTNNINTARVLRMEVLFGVKSQGVGEDYSARQGLGSPIFPQFDKALNASFH